MVGTIQSFKIYFDGRICTDIYLSITGMCHKDACPTHSDRPLLFFM